MPIEQFNPIYRPVNNPIDLDKIGKAYDTLEQGHQQAIATASAIEGEIAKLDLNEAEDSWRQEQINKIKSAIADNSQFGNAYTALDDVIKANGSLMSQPGMIGRLRSQQDYKKYINNVEARQDLPEDYKQFYKEINPYTYSDKKDKKGNVIGGSKWEAIDNPTAVIPLSQLIKEGINIAAKEAGGGTQTRWLDSEGRITDDPSKVFDGEIYSSTTGQWQRLTKEKIREGIKAFIESTPGAKESLNQDYKIAKWKKDKNGSNPDIEDKNGITLDEDAYLEKRINPAINAAAYYNSTSNTTYGAGLKSYKAAQRAAQQSVQNSSSSLLKDGTMGTQSTPVTMSYDYIGNLKSTKQTSANNLHEVFKTLTGRDVRADMTNASPTAWSNAIDNALKNSKLSKQEQAQILNIARKNIRDYQESIINYNDITKGLDDKQKSTIDFVGRMNAGGDFDKNNEYDSKVLNQINNIFGTEGKAIRLYTNNDNFYNNILTTLNGITVDGAKKLGYQLGIDNDGKQYIELNKNNYNQIVLFSNAVKSAYDKVSWYGAPFTFSGLRVVDDKGQKLGPTAKGGDAVDKYQSLIRISNIYNEANDKTKRELSMIAPQTVTLSNTSLGHRNFTEAQLLHKYNTGQLEEKEYNLLDKNVKAQFNNLLINHQYTQGRIFEVKDKNGAGTLENELDSEKRLEIGNNIKSYIGTNAFRASAAHNVLYGNGSNITIYNKLDKDGNPIGEPKTYFIPELILEQAGKDFDNDAYVKASDKILLGNEIKKTNVLSTKNDTPTLGEQKIICHGNDQYSYNINNKNIPINKTNAIKITQYMNEYNDIKDSYKSGDIFVNSRGNEKQIMESLDNSIKQIAYEMATNSNMPNQINAIYNSLINDLNK